MKLSLSVLLIAFFSLLAVPGLAAPDTIQQTTSVSTKVQTNSDAIEGEVGSPVVLVLLIAGIIITAIGIGIGVVIAVIILFILFALLSAGIVSASIMRGYNKKSFAAGFKTFLVLTSGALGLFLSAGALLVANKLFDLNLTTTAVILMGGICGLLAGMVVGIITYYIFNLMFLRFKQKMGWF